ncbi:MAG: PAS domain-containing protein, partial [Mariprofundus sp.]|nr:PAS domain-containing protein [Mariprofundus sp.]
MKNLLDSTDIATTFLDTEFCIRRFTPRISNIIPLAASDSGRPIKHFSTMLEDVNLTKEASGVLDDLIIREKEVISNDHKTYLMRLRPYRTISNVIDGIVLTFQDITKRKKTEEALLESERRSHTWLDASPVCTKVVNLDFNLQYMSASGARALKIDNISEYYGKPYPFHFYPESSRKIASKCLQSVKATGKIVAQEYRVCDLQGSPSWYHSTFIPVNNDEGLIDHIMVVSVETTARKHVEKALRKSEHFFRMTFEHAPDAMLLIDAETGAIEAFNAQIHEHLGYTREEFGQLTIADIVAGESPDEVTQNVAKIT